MRAKILIMSYIFPGQLWPTDAGPEVPRGVWGAKSEIPARRAGGDVCRPVSSGDVTKEQVGEIPVTGSVRTEDAREGEELGMIEPRWQEERQEGCRETVQCPALVVTAVASFGTG